MEICYNNAAYTQYSTVNSTAATGMYWGRYQDISSGDGCSNETWTLTTAPPGRANTCFVINTLTGTGNFGNAIPSVYSLSQNYPNPFNPVTKINYSIPKSSLTKLRVYDLLGREVTTLVNDMKQPGMYSVDFDGTNFSSGVYFYKLEAGTFTEVKRMIMIK
jgi:hypothetical protein